jgi:gamma-glutamyl hercynylcysteine S-oxide synthase
MELAYHFRNADRRTLHACMQEARVALEGAFAVHEMALQAVDFAVPNLPVVNLPLWEIGHVAWFQERWLLRNPELGLGVRCNPAIALTPSSLPGADEFYDSSAVDHDTRWQLPLPDVSQTRRFASDVLHRSLGLLAESKANTSSDYLFWLCSAHEFMHAEAFAYTANTLKIPGADTFTAQCFNKAKLLHGMRPDYARQSRFSFDNESALQIDYANLEDPKLVDLDELPVSWALLQEFRDSADYKNEKFWPGRGLEWLQARVDAKNLRAKPLDPLHSSGAACHVSFWEAQAWCLWRGRALPSEAQWLAGISARGLPWGQVWEWTDSEFTAFQGFVAHPYRDYSQPFFNKGYRVLKGGSIYTHERMKHPLYRNFFLPSRDDVCTGFRSCAAL